jgi:two-component system, cell cycle response regulator
MGERSVDLSRRRRVTTVIQADAQGASMRLPQAAGNLDEWAPFDDDTLRLANGAPTRRGMADGRDRGTLLVLQGTSPGHLYAVSPARPTTLGRGEAADVLMDENSVSRLHARIQPVGGRYFVEDLGSANRTFVNGEALRGRRELSSGDVVTLGLYATLRFDLHSFREQQALLELERSAVREPLTGLLRRSYFEERLAAEVGFATRRGNPLAVVMMDIDHFKRINDRHGHPAGDAVLRVVAQTVRRMLRPEDFIGRYGGEEFIVAARDTDGRNAIILAERVRRIVQDAPFSWESHPLKLTISLGVSAVERGAQATKHALVSAADAALYDAKRMGRNRVAHRAPGGAVVSPW